MAFEYSGILINLLSSVIEKVIITGGSKIAYEVPVAKLLKKANLLKLEDSFESIYLHSFLKMIEDEANMSWMKVFSFDDFVSTFHRSRFEEIEDQYWIDTVNKLITYNVYKFNILLPLFQEKQTDEVILNEINRLNKAYDNIKSYARKPSDQDNYNNSIELKLEVYRLREQVEHLTKENERKSFDYQFTEYLKRLTTDFYVDFIQSENYIPVNGKVENKYLSTFDRQKLREKILLETEDLRSSSQLANDENSPISEIFEKDSIDSSLTFENDSNVIIPTDFTQFSPLDDYINSWLLNDSSNLLIIIGEYGTGKTTFLRYIFHQLATKILEPDNSEITIKDQTSLPSRLPAYLPLYDFEDKMSTFIISNFNNHGVSDISYSDFTKKAKEGKFILLIDGFDEMSHTMGFDNKLNNARKILNLLALSEKTKMILTVRNEYFQSDEEFEEIFNLKSHTNISVAHTNYFNRSQIKAYVTNKIPKEPGRYLSLINTTYDLLDLAKRPVLLDFIVKYLPRFLKENKKSQNLNITKRISASDLYEFAINSEANRKLNVEAKFKPYFRRVDRISILQSLALWLFQEGQILVFYLRDVISLGKVRNYIELTIGKKLLESEYENLLNRFLSFSFLIREADYKFRISHKSFSDYLVAKAMVSEIENNLGIPNFGRNIISENITFFIADQINECTSLINIARRGDLDIKDGQFSGSNALRVLIQKDKTLIKGLNLKGTSFQGVDFSNVDLTNTNFSQCNLIDCVFDHTFIKAVLYNTNCDGSTINARDSDIDNISNLENLTCLKSLDLENTYVENIAPLNNILKLKKVNIRNTKVNDKNISIFDKRAKRENISFLKTFTQSLETEEVIIEEILEKYSYYLPAFSIRGVSIESYEDIFFTTLLEFIIVFREKKNDINDHLNYFAMLLQRTMLEMKRKRLTMQRTEQVSLDIHQNFEVFTYHYLIVHEEKEFESQQFVNYVLGQLNEVDKNIMEYYIQGYPFQAISEILSISPNVLTARVHRSKQVLRKFLSDKHDI